MTSLRLKTIVEPERTELTVSSRERIDGGTAEVANVSSAISAGIPTTNCQHEGAIPEGFSLPASGGVPTSQTQSRVVRVVGFGKIKVLLQPAHRFFRDKWAVVRSWRVYRDQEKQVDLLYPDIASPSGCMARENPYHKRKLNNQASARTIKRLKSTVERNRLTNFKVASLVLTMPKPVSKWLAGQLAEGWRLAWRLYEGWWREDLPAVIKQVNDLASYTNLHPYRTENPLEPHFHFHTLIPNYGMVEMGIEDENGQPSYGFGEWTWARQRGGKLVPFSDEQMEALKGLWQSRVERFCRKHGINWSSGKVDVYVEFVDTDQSDGWAKLMHKVAYQSRHWSENFAEYSNQHPDCADPEAWLTEHENRARLRGWWCLMSKIAVTSDTKEKVSPYTGKPMTNIKVSRYDRISSYASLVRYAGGCLGAVEFIRGKPVETMLSQQDLKFLEGAMEAGHAGELEPD